MARQQRFVLTAASLLGLAVLGFSCGSPSTQGPGGAPAPGSQPTRGAAGTPARSAQSEAPALPGSEALVELAKQDLAQRSGLPVGEIRIVGVTAMTWPDSSLGCPEAGKIYAQVVTPGYRIVLSAGGKSHVYNSDQEDTVVYCQR